MLGLNGLLNLGTRSLQAQRTATEVVGNNIANASNAAYARQKVDLQSSTSIDTKVGEEGTGVDVTGISQIRNTYLDAQIQDQKSVTGSLTAQQTALQQAEAVLGQSLDQTGQSSGSSTSDTTGTQHGIGDAINNLFSSLQTLSNDPTSMSQRQVFLTQAQDLATRFNQTDTNLSDLQSSLDTQLEDNVSKANTLLTEIAKLNQQISDANASGGNANELIDTRTSRLEDLAELIKTDVTTGDNGMVNISINDQSLVTGNEVNDTLTTTDGGDGQILVQTQQGSQPISPTGGSIQGIIEVRDGSIATLKSSLDTLAQDFITEMNTVHATGFGLNGTNGEDLFSGDSASTIAVNSDLTSNPALLQLSGNSGSSGDNSVALAMAQLADKSISDLNDLNFYKSYTQAVTVLGQDASSINTQISDQTVVSNMLSQQRTSLSGVSLDEEMSDMIKYQQAFQASAKIVNTVDEMMDTVLNMKS